MGSRLVCSLAMSASLALCCCIIASRVLTWSKVAELRSLRIAAVSGSGQSARLTNSYFASATLSGWWDVESRRGPGGLSVSGMSHVSVIVGGADSLKSWRDSATLRPMPALGRG